MKSKMNQELKRRGKSRQQLLQQKERRKRYHDAIVFFFIIWPALIDILPDSLYLVKAFSYTSISQQKKQSPFGGTTSAHNGIFLRSRDRMAVQQEAVNSDQLDTQQDEIYDDDSKITKSHMTFIKCQNVAGMKSIIDTTRNHEEDESSIQKNGNSQIYNRSIGKEIVIPLVTNNRNDSSSTTTSPNSRKTNLIVITGETGSGKSLLVSKVLNLMMGFKATNALFPNSDDGNGSTEHVVGEVELQLSEPHLSLTRRLLDEMGIVIPSLTNEEESINHGTLILKRTIEKSPSPSSNKKTRMKNKCQINGKQVTLKALRSVTTPLIATVDAPAAAAALSQPRARMNIIDSWIQHHILDNSQKRSSNILNQVREAKKKYRNARRRREGFEKELEEMVLPSSFSTNSDDNSDKELELLQHWIDELDEFSSKLETFRKRIISSPGIVDLLKKSENSSNEEVNTGSLSTIIRRFAACSWMEEGTEGEVRQSKDSISSSYYSNLLDIREAIKGLDAQLELARLSCESLSSLASSQSVLLALEQSRQSLFDIAGEGNRKVYGVAKGNDDDDDDPISKAVEKSHELLNDIETALNAARKSMEDDPKGLISTLENIRRSIGVSVEEIDEFLVDWGSLSRKHMISPYHLPDCHKSLLKELDGNVEARLLLPEAIKDENDALEEFETLCDNLSKVRKEICHEVSKKVSNRLASLGMEGSSFKAQINSASFSCTDYAAYGDGSSLGLDEIDFFLLHGEISKSMTGLNNVEKGDNEQGGRLEIVGSAGEKARILLAIETDFPGSIGASLRTNHGTELKVLDHDNVPPVAVVYDEIDAHVGGRAAVAVAKLLAEQTLDQVDKNDGNNPGRGQVISITHSPSIAAMADHHVVIQKTVANGNANGNFVSVQSVGGIARRKELARMASGDICSDEAELFAEALLRNSST